MRIDWSKIAVAKAKQIADFIIVCYDRDAANQKFEMKVYHYLSDKKDVDVALYAFRSLMSARKGRQNLIDSVVVISDGGPSDFHMKQWVHYEFTIAHDLGVDLEHIIMAPHHGDGPCDSAKSQANKKLSNTLLQEPVADVTLNTVATIFNSVNNHTAMVVQLGNVVAYPDAENMHQIRDA